MKVIVCVDDQMGTMFNHRRQSRDRVLISDVAREVRGTLYLTPYTARMLCDIQRTSLSDAPLCDAADGDTVFVEGFPLLPHLDKIDTLVLYRWNTVYPQDMCFDLPLEHFTLSSCEEFKGYSHEKITKEVYKK